MIETAEQSAALSAVARVINEYAVQAGGQMPKCVLTCPTVRNTLAAAVGAGSDPRKLLIRGIEIVSDPFVAPGYMRAVGTDGPYPWGCFPE